MAEKYQTVAKKSMRSRHAVTFPSVRGVGKERAGDECAAAAGRGVGRPAAGGRASDRDRRAEDYSGGDRRRNKPAGGATASSGGRLGVPALGSTAQLREFLRSEGAYSPAPSAHTGGSGGGIGELCADARRRTAATRRAGRHRRRTEHEELLSCGAERSGRLRHR